MENIVSRTFDSPLTLDQMLAQLGARVGGVEWTVRESEHDDRYIKGLTSEGVKLRILQEGPAGKFTVEVYFPLSDSAEPLLANADKRAFLKRLDGHVLAAIKAANIKDE
jgi:hypothetical protein